MKKIIKVFILSCLIFFTYSVKANSVSSISMNIYIDNNGNAHVTEVWNAKLNSGTEGYKPYYNLGDSEITDFKVMMDDTNFVFSNQWNIKDSFEDKAYRNGIHKISDGVELCFGISEYGRHNYVLSYTITNFVYQLTDSQMVYFILMPHNFSNEPDNVYIKIYSDFKYSDSLDVWGYGYEGYAYVYDGYIEMSTKNGLDSNEYMVVLIKFPDGSFSNLRNLNKDFDDYYNMAEEGAIHHDDSAPVWLIILVLIFQILFWIFLCTLIYVMTRTIGTGNQKYKLNFGIEGKKIKEVPNFRDIPCNKDIFRAYYLAYNFDLMKKQTDLLGAVLLKWTKEQKITIDKKEKSGLFSKEETSIILSTDLDFNNSFEKSLYDMLYEASKDGILQSKEFEKWCKTHYSKILKWFTEVLDRTAEELIQEGKIIEVEKKALVFKYKEYNIDNSLREEAKQLKGLKQFLIDFTNIKDREAIEVHLFDEYLMFASIFGIADKVAKQFKEIYPETIYDYDYDSVIFINTFSYNGVYAASVAQSRAQSYSSGGGGFSSSGGGGGSFGGGGGGGGFR